MVKINLLPWRKAAKSYQKKVLQKMIVGAVLLVVLVVLITHLILSRKEERLRIQIIGKQEDIQNRDRVNLLAANKINLQQNRNQPSTLTRLFIKLGKSFKSNVCFTEISLDNDIVLFVGQTHSTADLTDFLINWNAAALFSQIQIEQLQQMENQAVQFRFRGFKFVESSNNIYSEAATKISAMSTLAMLAHLSGLTIQSATFQDALTNDLNAKEGIIRLVMQGEFQQMSGFIFGLDRLSSSEVIQNFSCRQNEENKLTIVMNILPNKMQSLQINDQAYSKPLVFNPFCSASHTMISDHHSAALLSAPLRLLKMTGYLQQGNNVKALILLPNNELAAVSKGAIVGKDHGVVNEIQHDQILIMLPDKKIFLMKMNNN